MVEKRLFRLLTAAALAAGVLMSAAARPRRRTRRRSRPARARCRGIDGQDEESIDVKADGEVKARRYVPTGAVSAQRRRRPRQEDSRGDRQAEGRQPGATGVELPGTAAHREDRGAEGRRREEEGQDARSDRAVREARRDESTGCLGTPDRWRLGVRRSRRHCKRAFAQPAKKAVWWSDYTKAKAEAKRHGQDPVRRLSLPALRGLPQI